MKITLEDMKPYSLACMERVGSYGIENNRLMTHFKEYINKRNILNEKSIIQAMIYDNPIYVNQTDCRYAIGIVNDAADECELTLIHEQGGRYCILEIDHTEEAIKACWSIVFHLLEERKHTFDPKRAIIERYRQSLLSVHRCEICVPIL